jgi:hypothetical protein
LFEEPTLHIIRFPDDGGERRAERERQRSEGRRRYGDGLTGVLDSLGCRRRSLPPTPRPSSTISSSTGAAAMSRAPARAIRDCLTRLPRPGLRLPVSANTRGAESRFRRLGGRDGRLPGVAGGSGTRGCSAGELDLRPSGRFSTVWRGGDLDDDGSYEPEEVQEGDVIAQGTVSVDGYGDRPAARVAFIAEIIRDHLRRQRCQVHQAERDDLELLFGRPCGGVPTAVSRCETGG